MVAVGIGGLIGALLRYAVSKMIPTPFEFPLETLFINYLGCLFLAWFFTITATRWSIGPNLRLAIGTGFTGAFTTFSTFSVETVNLMRNHHILTALLYVLLSIFGGIGLAFVGAKLATLNSGRVKQVGGE